MSAALAAGYFERLAVHRRPSAARDAAVAASRFNSVARLKQSGTLSRATLTAAHAGPLGRLLDLLAGDQPSECGS